MALDSCWPISNTREILNFFVARLCVMTASPIPGYLSVEDLRSRCKHNNVLKTAAEILPLFKRILISIESSNLGLRICLNSFNGMAIVHCDGYYFECSICSFRHPALCEHTALIALAVYMKKPWGFTDGCLNHTNCRTCIYNNRTTMFSHVHSVCNSSCRKFVPLPRVK